MRGRAPDPIVAALAMLCDERRRAAARTAVGTACVLTRRNADALPALIDLADRLGVDFVSISNVVPHTAAMADEALWQRSGQYSSTRPSALRPRLIVGRFDAGDATRPLLDRLLRQAPTVPPPALDPGLWRNRCRFAQEGVLAVAWDGRVAPCLSLLYTHPEYIGGREKTVRAYEVGHVLRTPLREIWRDASYREFRRRVRVFDVSPCLSCGGCSISETNEADCFGTPFPACSECLWAQGLVLCP
jgi:MoaA/NifB/PqqE/SkfB family radical SAM enzyme